MMPTMRNGIILLCVAAILFAVFIPPIALCVAALPLLIAAPTVATLRRTVTACEAQPLALRALVLFRAPPA